jgi:hypothetical protein
MLLWHRKTSTGVARARPGVIVDKPMPGSLSLSVAPSFGPDEVPLADCLEIPTKRKKCESLLLR